tara:strand:+ start:1055 stop:1399 length:345 start_codon:yes stop_codon:yes gene_type:complete
MVQQFLIYGLTIDGKKFRPSDWADRFCGVLAPFNNKGLERNIGRPHTYSRYAYPLIFKGEKVVFVDRCVEDIEALAWQFIISFVKDNNLMMVEVDSSVRQELFPNLVSGSSMVS